jgi:uridine kinase
MKRRLLLEEVASRIVAEQPPHPVRVAIDGVDAAGKTTLADELEPCVRARGRPVVRASIDRFHNPRRIRHRRGRDSPEGYFRDSFDLEALQSLLLRPLGPGGSRRYRPEVFDHSTDLELDPPFQQAAANAVLLLDGVFLHRPELIGYWELTIFLVIPLDIMLSRMARREGTEPSVAASSYGRYLLGQEIYLAECEPEAEASLVIDNGDPAAPFLKRGV